MLLATLAGIEARIGAFDAARACFDAGARLVKDAGDPIGVGLLLARRALVLADSDRDDARATLDEAERIAAAAGLDPRSTLGRRIALAREALGARRP